MFDDGVTSVSFRYTSTWLKREWSQLFTGATGVSAPMSVPFPFTIFARTSRYVLARSRYASPVPGKMNSIGPPESRDVNGWCSIQPPSSILVCVGGTANKSSSLFTPSHDCLCTNAILGEYVRSLSLSFGFYWSVNRLQFVLYVSLTVQFVLYVCLGVGVWREDCSSGLFRLL